MADAIDKDRRVWNKEKLRLVISEEEVQAISLIPVSFFQIFGLLFGNWMTLTKFDIFGAIALQLKKIRFGECGTSKVCPICGQFDESIEHLLFDCSWV